MKRDIIRRAWNATTAEGTAKDRFANTVSARVGNEVEPPIGGSVELVDNWLEIADRMYDDGADADTVDISELWEYQVD